MTTVTFHTEDDSRITGFQVQGHSGYGPEGEDIVCAAITSAVRMVECSFNDVMGLKAHVKVKPEDTSITLRLPGGLSPQQQSTCQTILTGMMLHLLALHEEYPENIEVLEDEMLP